jgi:hypothetical protein
MTEKAEASGNALDRPTSVWSEMARKHVEPILTEKANDDRRSSVDASQSGRPNGHPHVPAALDYCQALRNTDMRVSLDRLSLMRT